MPDSAAGMSPAKSTGLKSMTGFAQARREESGRVIRITLRSVNHRFLDIHVKAPEGFEALENGIRQSVRTHLRRGHVDVILHYDPSGPAAVAVNREIAAAYLSAAQSLRKEFGLTAELDLAGILRLPGVVSPPESLVAGEDDELAATVQSCLAEALTKLDEMRKSEGRILSEELSNRLRSIRELAARIEPLAERTRPAYSRRIEARLRELIAAVPVDPARIAQEAAIAAERSDTSEEIARLRSHVQQFESLLASGGEIGKKLDFLLQEMQREANTLLSKTPGTENEGLEITRLALEVKAEVEKLREQVQNLE
jgi:uncharacterized protein (TIGR00255 family)